MLFLMTHRRLSDPRRRQLLRAGLASAAVMLPVLGPGLRAGHAGNGVDGLDLDWHDARRDRPVPVRLYLPVSTGKPVPLVLFSHGIGGSRQGYRYLGEHFAAEGFASLHIQHVGSDRSLWAAGSPLALVARLQAAAQASEAIARVHDLRFALDTMLAGPLGARVDPQRVVAAGHSYGANTALLAAGARVVRDGEALDLREPRLRAVILLSAPPFHGEPEQERIVGAVRIPTLHVTNTEDTIRVPGYHSNADDRVAIFEAMGGERKVLAVFEGGGHSVFTDRRGPGGPLLNGRVKDATKALALAFVRSVVQGDDALLQAWRQDHADLLARYVGPG